MTGPHEDEPRPCEQCGGSGMEMVGHHVVTADMASDAGDPEMAGMQLDPIWEPCSVCEGAGWIARVTNRDDADLN